jgi:SHOCT-like domain
MNEHRREILDMLASGKITADEADRLIAALDKGQSLGAVAATTEPGVKPRPKYLRVLVESEDMDEDGPVKVNVRIPM